jgi:restriction system protein
MGRRRKKQGPEEVMAGLLGLGVLYLFVTGKFALFLRFLPILVVFIVALVALALVLRKTKAVSSPQYEVEQRSAPTLYRSAGLANPPLLDVLDRVRAAPWALPASVEPRRPIAWSLSLIRDLDWKRFEELCEGYWKAKGYRAELTSRGADGGIDVNLYSPSNPDKLLAIMQCKSRSQDQVGVAIVRELYGVMHHVGAPMGILLTSTGFHQPAREFAAGKHIQLIDGTTLLKQLDELPADASAALLAHITRDDYITPTCPNCDVKMVTRTRNGDGKAFYGCVNYPRCKSVINLRQAHS